MNTRSSSALVLLAALCALALAPLSAASNDPAPFGVRIDQVPRGDNAVIARGTTLMSVLRLMGPAHQKLSRDIWVYQNHRVDSEAANTSGCDTLVLTFAHGRLADLQIVNARAVAVIAANLKTPANSVQVARK